MESATCKYCGIKVQGGPNHVYQDIKIQYERNGKYYFAHPGCEEENRIARMKAREYGIKVEEVLEDA